MSSQFESTKYFQHIMLLAREFKKSEAYTQAINLLIDCYLNQGTIYTMGCGGSASTATHFAADLAKTTIIPGLRRFKAMALVDNIPLVSAWTNDSGWGTVFAEQLRPWITDKDILIGFSVHGGGGKGDAGPWSQNLVQAMTLAKEKGSKIIGFAGFDGGAMARLADVPVIVPITDDVYGTPAIEAFHVVLHHGIIFELKERIKKYNIPQ